MEDQETSVIAIMALTGELSCFMQSHKGAQRSYTSSDSMLDVGQLPLYVDRPA